MSLLDRITADQQEVAAKTAELNAANQQLATDNASLAAIQPALDLITQLEGMTTDFTTVAPLLEEVRNALTA